MNHCMLDLETFGTSAGCVLRSIGAIVFDPRQGIAEEFYQNITEEDQTILGAVKNPQTVAWWEKQSKESQEVFTDDQVRLEVAMIRFIDFWQRNRLKYLWSQGSNFDGILLQWSIELVDKKVPWRFYNTRDTRTAYDMAGFDPKSMKRQGVYHNALDDAKHQCRCVYRSYQMIDGKIK